MDIREFTTYNENSPITGYGVWIVLEESGHKAQLFHPVHLKELTVTEYEFVTGSGQTIWPMNGTGVSFNAAKFMDSLKRRVAFFIENERAFPIQTVAKVIAEFEEISLDEAMAQIKGFSYSTQHKEIINPLIDKINRVYRIRKDCSIIHKIEPRAVSIVNALKENGPATIYQITSLVDGKLTTKSDLRRVVTYFVNKLTSQGVLEIMA